MISRLRDRPQDDERVLSSLVENLRKLVWFTFWDGVHAGARVGAPETDEQRRELANAGATYAALVPAVIASVAQQAEGPTVEPEEKQ